MTVMPSTADARLAPGDRSAGRSRGRLIAARLLLVLLAILLPLAALEAAFRVAGPFIPGNYDTGSYLTRDPLRVAGVELGGVRSLTAVPLLKDGDVIGAIAIYREQPGGFDQGQIGLVNAFADQAVTAIENARLINETREALEQQTATAQVLEIINTSP